MSYITDHETLETNVPTQPHMFIADKLSEYFRIPVESLCSFELNTPAGETGFFRFGPSVVCYGRYKPGQVSSSPTEISQDALNDVRICGEAIQLSFDPSQVIDNLRNERYTSAVSKRTGAITSLLRRKVYYSVR